MAVNPGLPISRLINVAVVISPIPPLGEDIDTALLLGSSTVIDVVERMRVYNDIEEVAGDFGTTTPEYLAAVLWFEQSPQPVKLNIGRWAATDTKAHIIGGALTTANKLITAWTGISNGAFFLFANRIPYSITGLDFSSVTNLNGVASVVQAALVSTIGSGYTVVYDSVNNRFEVVSGAVAGVASTFSLLSPPTSTGFVHFTGVPSPADTVTLDGTVVTFVASSPSTNEVLIGGTAAITALNLATFINASTDVNIVKMNAVQVGAFCYLSAAATGSGGDSLTLSKSGTNIAVSGATFSGGTGTDVSAKLAGTVATGAYVANGIAAESMLDAVILLDVTFSNQWYGLVDVAPQATDADRIAVANYIEAANNRHYYATTSSEATILTANDTTNIAYELKQLGLNKTAVHYSSENLYAAASYLGRILTVDWNGNSTVITLMYKQEPGIVPEVLTETQIDALESFNANTFVEYNNDTAIIERGTSASGEFTDTIIGLDWLASQIQSALYNRLYTSPTKIPQTDAGNAILAADIAAVCAQGVNNGLLAPGVWTNNGFGALRTGDVLKNGFYIYAPPVATQSQADRAARKSVPFQIAVKLAGAIHTVNATIFVSR